MAISRQEKEPPWDFEIAETMGGEFANVVCRSGAGMPEHHRCGDFFAEPPVRCGEDDCVSYIRVF